MLVLSLLTTLAAVGAVFYAWRTVNRARMALVTEIRLQRLQMATGLANVLSAIHRAAGSHPPHDADLSSLQCQLKAELAIFHAINGPPLPVTHQLVASALDDAGAARLIAHNSLGELADAVYDDRLLVELDKNLNPVLTREGQQAGELNRSRIRRLIDGIRQLAASDGTWPHADLRIELIRTSRTA